MCLHESAVLYRKYLEVNSFSGYSQVLKFRKVLIIYKDNKRNVFIPFIKTAGRTRNFVRNDWWWNLGLPVHPRLKILKCIIGYSRVPETDTRANDKLEDKNMPIFYFVWKHLIISNLCLNITQTNKPFPLQVWNIYSKAFMEGNKQSLWQDKWTLSHDSAVSHRKISIKRFLTNRTNNSFGTFILLLWFGPRNNSRKFFQEYPWRR